MKEEEPEMKILEDKEGMSAYEAALYDVKDPLLPVRGHGIIELNKLVENKVTLILNMKVLFSLIGRFRLIFIY